MTRLPAVWSRLIAMVMAVLAGLILTVTPAADAQAPRLVLGTTVGLQQSGLLDVLAPLAERQIGRQVTVVAVSSPQALALGARGELDVLLVDATEDEEGFVGAGHGLDRRLAFHTDEVILGPRDDPARVRGASDVSAALQQIATTPSTWVSRADNSGLYQLEKRLWREAGVEPLGQPWYVPLGQGMAATLAATTERQGYTLAERQAFLARRDLLDLAVMFEGGPELLRLFHVIAVNPAKGAWIDAEGARAFGDWLLGSEARAAIRAFGTDRYGQPIFVPDAGRTERDLVPERPRAG